MDAAIDIMVKKGHIEMLDHRVVLSLLESKWNSYVNLRFWASVALEFIYLITLLVVVVLQPIETGNSVSPNNTRFIVRYCLEIGIVFMMLCYVISVVIVVLRHFSCKHLSSSINIIAFLHCLCILGALFCRIGKESDIEDIFLAFGCVLGWFHFLTSHFGKEKLFWDIKKE